MAPGTPLVLPTLEGLWAQCLHARLIESRGDCMSSLPYDLLVEGSEADRSMGKGFDWRAVARVAAIISR